MSAKSSQESHLGSTLKAKISVKSRNFLPVLIVVLVWAALYLPKLRTVPGWYGDETMTFVVSCDLFKGSAVNFSLWNTFWHPHYPYQQLYSWICGMFGFLGGGDIVAGRFLNTLLALAGALFLWFLGRDALGRMSALFGALIFLSYYQSIIHFRMCYAHNAAGIGILVMTLFLMRSACWKNSLYAGCGLGFAAGAHPIFSYAAIAAFVCRFNRPRSWAPLFLPAFLIVASSLFLSYLRFGDWLFEDLKALAGSFSSTSATYGGGRQALFNFLNFVFQDWFHLGALLGLLLSLCRRFIPVAVVAGTCLILLTKNRANLTVFYYQAVIVLPVLCLCWARIYNFFSGLGWKVGGKNPAWLLWGIPMFCLWINLGKIFSGTMVPLNQYWVTQSPAEVEEAARWINERTSPQDTVAANNNIAWLLKAKTVWYPQMITWYGLPTQDLYNKRERFRYDASLENVKYAVVGDIDKRWTFGEQNASVIVQKFQQEQWPVVWQGPNYMILLNPRNDEKQKQ